MDGYRISVDQKHICYTRKDKNGRAVWTWTPAIWLETSRNVHIPAAYLKRPGAERTILYSHANAEDLGSSLTYAEILMQSLNVNVFVYEYSSYGHSYKRNGKKVVPSEAKTNADILAAYQYLREEGVEPRNIVVFGRSVGSGPSCYLAANRDVGGLVLISGLSSIFRVVAPWLPVTLPGDMFANIDLMKKVRCPVLSVHGEQDEVVAFSNAKALFDAAHRHSFSPYWHPEGKHNNVEFLNWDRLVQRYEEFLSALPTHEQVMSESSPKRFPRGKLGQCLQFCAGPHSRGTPKRAGVHSRQLQLH